MQQHISYSKMPYDKEQFLKFFSSSFYDKILNKLLLSYKNTCTKSEAKDKLYNSYLNLINYNYSINKPIEYIHLVKNFYVARIIPVFTIEDEGIYYFLCKQLEEDIAHNRIEGTFGGWQLGNKIKEQEDEEIQYVFNSYNPWMWTKYWKAYQHYIYLNLEKYDFKYALKLDIANFYDSIDIEILRKKLYDNCSKEKFDIIDQIIYILKYWNRRFNKYCENNVGIPQNEMGDQSRLLANLYLNDYDEKIFNTCNENDALYSRYADDQIILFNNDEDIYRIMLIVNDELKKIGLNLNSGKVKKFTKNQLINYYLFKPLELLEQKKYNEASEMFWNIVTEENGINNVRSDTFFRRCLSKDIGLDKFDNNNRKRILNEILSEKFIVESNSGFLNKIYNNLLPEEQEIFIDSLLKYFKKHKFDGFHHSVINFLKKNHLDEQYYYCLQLM